MCKKALVFFSLFVLLLFNFTNNALAALITYNTTAPGKSQAKTLWCWAACSVSIVYAIRTVTINQTTYVTEALGTPTNTGLKTDLVLKYLGDVGGISGVRRYDLSVPAPSFSQVKSQIAAKKPVYCKIAWFSDVGGVGHAVLVASVQFDNGDTSVQSVRVMDPSNGAFTYMDYQTLANNYKGSGYWCDTLWQFAH